MLFGYLMLVWAQRNHTCLFITVTLRRLIHSWERCHAIQRVKDEIGVKLYRMSQKKLAVFFFIFSEQSSDTGGRPMPEICNFMFRPGHNMGEPVVKEQEALFVKCSFKTSYSVMHKQRMFRHRYLLNMNQHLKETSVGCWVNNRRRTANWAT